MVSGLERHTRRRATLPWKPEGVRWASWDGGTDHGPGVRQQLSRGSAERRPGPSPSAGTSAGVGLVPKGRDALREVPVPQTRGLLAAWRAAALSCPSPATQHQGAPVGRVLSERTGQVPYVPKPATPSQCPRPRGRRPSSPRLRQPRPVFTGSLLVGSTFTVFLLAKIFPSRGRGHSGTADPWALLRWLRSLDADFCSEQRYSWPDMKGQIMTARFLRAVYPD